MCILLSHLLYGIYISHLLKWTQHTNKTQLHFTTLLMKPVILLRFHICVRFLNMSFQYKILSAFLYTNQFLVHSHIYLYNLVLFSNIEIVKPADFVTWWRWVLSSVLNYSSNLPLHIPFLHMLPHEQSSSWVHSVIAIELWPFINTDIG